MRTVSLGNAEASSLIRDSLIKGQEVSFKVTGSSMKPMFQHQKTVVHVGPLYESLKKYDIILIALEEQLLLHRIIKLKPLTTRGDALLRSELINEQDVLGIVKQYEYNGKKYTIQDFGWQFKYYINRITVYIKYSILKVVRRLK